MTGLLLLTAVLAGPLHADTTVAARQGDVVVVTGFQGELTARGWNRDVLSVERDGRENAGVTVRRTGNRIEIRPDGRRGDRPMDLVLSVPSGVGLEVEGLSLEVTVEGISGDVRVRNVDGDVELSEIRGSVEVFTIAGEVSVETVRGRVRVDAQSGDVEVVDAVGDVWVTSGSGDLDLEGVQADRVFAETTSGDLTFRGSLRDGGSYEISTHSGDVDITLPDGTRADVTVSTFDGEFESEFPVTLQGVRPGGNFSFTLGGGGAAILTVKAFDGEIRFFRAGGGR